MSHLSQVRGLKSEEGCDVRDAALKPMLRMWQAEELNINGLQLFGYCKLDKAQEPLVPHVHEGCLEFICVLKGEDTYSIGNEKYPLHGGDIFISLPGQEHFSGEAQQGVGEYIWFQINPTAGGAFLGLSEENSQILQKRLQQWNTHRIHASGEIMHQAKKLHQAIRDKRDGLYCSSSLVCLLSLLADTQDSSPGIDDGIRAAMRYISEHLDSGLSIREISSFCGMSESGFKHKFRRETGYAPGDYINRQRILHAREMMANGCSITRAAMDTGFNSSDYFTVVFKKYTRQTPTEFIASRES